MCRPTHSKDWRVIIKLFQHIMLFALAWCKLAAPRSIVAMSIKSSSHLWIVRMWEGFHLHASRRLAVVRPANRKRLFIMGRFRLEVSLSRRTNGENGTFTDRMLDSISEIPSQKTATPGHSHIIWMKVPTVFWLQSVQLGDGRASNLCNRRGV